MRQAIVAPILILSLALTGGAAATGAASPPQGRNYFVHVMGLADDPYETEVACLRFDATSFCSTDAETCLDWERSEGGVQTAQVSGIAIEGEVDDDGLTIFIEGQGRIEGRGRKSSISISARAEALGFQMNFVIAGRQVSRGRCLRMVQQFEAARAVGR